jgi:hypothetical protein
MQAPTMERQVSIVDEIDGKSLYSIWGSTSEDIEKFRTPYGEDRSIMVSPKYIPNKDDNIKIYTTLNRGNIVKRYINHATLLIHSAENNKLYSMGFSSSENNKLCILSPDPTLIEAWRNKHPSNIPNLIYEQDNISQQSINKLKEYVKNSEGTFPLRRKIPQVCFDKLEYKAIFSRQRGAFNCWTALEDIFPDFTVHINETMPSVTAYLARGTKRRRRKSIKKKRRKTKRSKTKRSKTKRRKKNRKKISKS